jgi:polysaccharide export outer membrane protein
VDVQEIFTCNGETGHIDRVSTELLAVEREERIMKDTIERSSVGRWSVVVVAVLVMVMAAPDASAQKKDMPGDYVSREEFPPIYTGTYRISVGDVLEVTFFKTDRLNQTQTVGPDGEIYLPIVGRVDAAGRSVEDVTQELVVGYSKELINPQITVNVAEYSGLQIYVSGEVFSPGIQPYRGGMTLFQAISNAGGFTKRAKRRSVLLIRPGPENEPVGTVVDFKKYIRKGMLQNDIELAPLDIVYVHWKNVVNVNIFMTQWISDNLPRFGPWMFYLPGYQEN